MSITNEHHSRAGVMLILTGITNEHHSKAGVMLISVIFSIITIIIVVNIYIYI